jgi:hypothetical protein
VCLCISGAPKFPIGFDEYESCFILTTICIQLYNNNVRVLLNMRAFGISKGCAGANKYDNKAEGEPNFSHLPSDAS